MFDHAATSPYDPFFTSGLLSAARTRFNIPSTAASPTSPDVPLSPRRGSLPDNYPLYSPTHDDDYDDENDDVFNFYHADAEDTMYFTLQPRSPPSAENLRSFLSLDLAESQSMRSASLRRKPSTGTSRSNWSKSTLSKKSTKAYSGFRFPETIPELPSLPTSTLPQPPHTAPIASTSKLPTPTPSQAAVAAAINHKRPSVNTLRLRFSRDSLRTIPSPKPAPSITLPEPPKSSRAGTPVSMHRSSSLPVAPTTAAAVTTSAISPIIVPSAAPTPASAPASVRAPTPSTASVSFVAPAPEAAAPKTKSKAPPRLPSLQPIPLELNIRMSALFASPPKPSATSNASHTAHAPPARVHTQLSKAPSTASSRFISPAPRRPEQQCQQQNQRRMRNRESVATVGTTRTVSTRARRWNRSEALARLEGRSPVSPARGEAGAALATTTTTVRPMPMPVAALTAAKLAMRMSAARNFMSMSDDDESDEEEAAAAEEEEKEEEDSGGEMVFLRRVAEDSEDDDDDVEEDLDVDFDDNCSSSSSSSGSSSSYVSLDRPLGGTAAGGVKHAEREGHASATGARGSGSSGGSASSGLSFPSLRGLVGRMVGLNPFMEAEDVVLPVQTLPPTTATATPMSQPPAEETDAYADVDIDDNFRFPAPPRTTAAERRLSLALSHRSSSTAAFAADDTVSSIFDGLFLEAPRSAPLPPPPPPYSPFVQAFPFPAYAQPQPPVPVSAAPYHHQHRRYSHQKGTHASSAASSSPYLAVPGPASSSPSPSFSGPATAPPSPSTLLALPGLRRKRTKTRGEGASSDAGLVSFIDFPDAPMTAPLPRRVIGERSDSLPEEMRALRRMQRRARYEREEEGQQQQQEGGSKRGSKDSSKDGSNGSKSSSWTWRSFIEVANV